MTDPRFKSSSGAFRAVHRSLADWVAGVLDAVDDLSDYDEAIVAAMKMREIEKHTDIDVKGSDQ